MFDFWDSSLQLMGLKLLVSVEAPYARSLNGTLDAPHQ